MLKYDVTMVLQSPLAHNDEQALSTTTPFRKLKLVVDGKPLDVPVYTGNAFRGLLRREAARAFVERVGIQELTDRQYHILYTGGMLEKGAGGDVLIAFKREFRKHIPFISLFGGSTGNTIIEGRMEIGMLYPVCKETTKYTQKEADKSCYELLQPIFYTHRDDREDGQTTVQMKYEVECLIPGTVLVSRIVLNTASPLEQAVFGATIRGWLNNPVLGGKSSVGHGLVAAEFVPGVPAGEAYYKYLDENKDAIKAFVELI